MPFEQMPLGQKRRHARARRGKGKKVRRGSILNECQLCLDVSIIKKYRIKMTQRRGGKKN